jgi:hypothetical protein
MTKHIFVLCALACLVGSTTSSQFAKNTLQLEPTSLIEELQQPAVTQSSTLSASSGQQSTLPSVSDVKKALEGQNISAVPQINGKCFLFVSVFERIITVLF